MVSATKAYNGMTLTRSEAQEWLNIRTLHLEKTPLHKNFLRIYVSENAIVPDSRNLERFKNSLDFGQEISVIDKSFFVLVRKRIVTDSESFCRTYVAKKQRETNEEYLMRIFSFAKKAEHRGLADFFSHHDFSLFGKGNGCVYNDGGNFSGDTGYQVNTLLFGGLGLHFKFVDRKELFLRSFSQEVYQEYYRQFGITDFNNPRVSRVIEREVWGVYTHLNYLGFEFFPSEMRVERETETFLEDYGGVEVIART